MERKPIRSKQIKSTGHDETGMEVEFHQSECPARNGFVCECEGNVYHYPNVTAEEHHALRTALPSVGSHFHKHIRPRHIGTRV